MLSTLPHWGNAAVAPEFCRQKRRSLQVLARVIYASPASFFWSDLANLTAPALCLEIVLLLFIADKPSHGRLSGVTQGAEGR